MLRDLRYALRVLRNAPGYTLACIAVLALAVGANATIFSFVDSVILHALPYPEANRLVYVWSRFPHASDPLFDRFLTSHRQYLEWKRQNTVFSDLAAMMDVGETETGVEHGRTITTLYLAPGVFTLLGARPAIGRLFGPNDDTRANSRVAVLSDRYFDRRFHRDPTALGKTITLGNTVYTVIGVLPPQFHLPSTWEGDDQKWPDAWVPLARALNTPEDESRRQLYTIAKLKPGVGIDQARAEMKTLAARVALEDPNKEEGWSANVYSFATEDSNPSLRRALLVLLAAVAFLLLIACANLANLALARATLRSREVAVRLALGASRARIISQLVIEAAVISIAGAIAGVVLARWSIRLILALKPPDLQRPEFVAINPTVLLFSAIACILTTLLFGVAPAIAASGTHLNTALKGGSWGSTAARVRSRQFLILVEVGLAVVLLAGAGLMIRSLRELISTGVGFDTTHLATVEISLPHERYASAPACERFYRTLLGRVRAIPGVTLAATTSALPLHQVNAGNFFLEGRPDPPANALPIADFANVSPDYMRLLGLRLIAGRFFTEHDLAIRDVVRSSAENSLSLTGYAIVNQAFVREYFLNENPIGRRLLSDDRKHGAEIVGVVSDYNQLGAENGVRTQIFRADISVGNATLLARTAGAPASAVKGLQAAAWSIDKDLTLDTAEAMEHYVGGWTAQRRFNTLLMTVFAGLALLLAMIGLYGVLSNLVASRVREIGIRMAIGATPGHIARLVLAQSMTPVLAGLAMGLAGALALGRFVEALLFHVHSADPLTLAATCLAILIVAPAAIFVPLRRATRVDCTVALRDE